MNKAIPVLISSLFTIYSYSESLESVLRKTSEEFQVINSAKGYSLIFEDLPLEREDRRSSSVRSKTELRGGHQYRTTTLKIEDKLRIYRIRLSEETLRYLIESQEIHVNIRRLAVEGIEASSLSAKSKVDLMKLALEQPLALLRETATREMEEAVDGEMYLELQLQALNDPCLDVSENVLIPIVKHFALRGEDGEVLLIRPGFASGSPEYFYFLAYQRAVLVATALNKVDSKTVPNEILREIENRRVPTDEWFFSRVSSMEDVPEAKKAYLQMIGDRAEQSVPPKYDRAGG